jgi:Spy/CpxP family protein refolding chaperone
VEADNRIFAGGIAMRDSLVKCASVAILAAGMVFAQSPTGDSQPGAGDTQEGRRGFMGGRFDLDHVAQALNLTDTQKEQARTIFEKARTASQPIRQQMRDNRDKLRAAAKVTNNETDIQKLATEQGRLVGKLIAIRTEASAKFYQMLTPEQRVKSDQMHEQFKQGVRSRRSGTDLRQ